MSGIANKRAERAQKWATAYSEWGVSGLSQRGYCQKTDLSFWKFKCGVELARKSGLIAKCRQGPDEMGAGRGFVPIQINGADRSVSPPEPYCEIRFQGLPGIRIETAESWGQFRQLLQFDA